MITNYGYDNFFSLIGLALILSLVGWLADPPYLAEFLIAAGVLLCLFTLWFFRDPHRSVPGEALQDDSIIVAPADGKVVQIAEVEETRLLDGKATQVSIFLSPVDVHVNRSPANGRILFSDYLPGKYLMAYDDKASLDNEQTVIGLENTSGKLLFKQITGFLARRIVCELKEGDSVKVGDKFGMMKFGSRMDLLLPPATEILVREGQRVRGGETILARMASA